MLVGLQQMEYVINFTIQSKVQNLWCWSEQNRPWIKVFQLLCFGKHNAEMQLCIREALMSLMPHLPQTQEGPRQNIWPTNSHRQGLWESPWGNQDLSCWDEQFQSWEFARDNFVHSRRISAGFCSACSEQQTSALCELAYNSGSHLEETLPLWGCLEMSGGIFGFHNWRREYH